MEEKVLEYKEVISEGYTSYLNSIKVRVDEELSENKFLHTLQYFLLRKKQALDTSLQEKFLDGYLQDIVNRKGFYDNHLFHRVDNGYPPSDNWSKTSHDQFISYCVYSKISGKADHQIIWSQFKENFSTYDNISGSFNLKRLVLPRDFIFVGYINENLICRLLIPFYYLFGFFTYLRKDVVRYRSNKRNGVEWFEMLYLKYIKREHKDEVFYKHVSPKTSGELLWWVKKHAMKDSWHKKLFYKFADKRIQKRFGGWDGLFVEYFKHDDHPIIKLLNS